MFYTKINFLFSPLLISTVYYDEALFHTIWSDVENNMGKLSRMKAFVDVVEAEGFSAAARKTHRSKALLSKHVRELEDELGVLLLNRTTRQLSLTEVGHAYYLRAIEILKELEDLQDTMSLSHNIAHGKIKISASRTFADAPIGKSLIDFMVDHPEVNLEIYLDDRFVDLVDEGFDLAIRITLMKDSSLIARRLYNIPLAIVASPKLLETTGVPLHPKELRNMPCLIDRNNSGFNNWSFINDDDSLFSVPVSGPLDVNGPIMNRMAAVAGIGFASLPEFVASNEIAQGTLTAVLDQYTIKDKGLYAVYPHRRYLPAKVRLMVDYLARWFKNYEKQH